MNKFPLNSAGLSRAVSTRLIDLHGPDLPLFIPRLIERFSALENDRAQMHYKTGSISLSAGVYLFMLANIFKPRIIVELGTFLGKSTTALALGASWNDPAERVLYTVDKDNPCLLPERIGNAGIVAHAGKTSTEMFRALVEQRVKADLLSLDGRLQNDDLPLVRELLTPETIILLDDFEGIEKGVANAQVLTALAPSHFFLPPVTDERLRHFGVMDSHCTAMLLPPSMLTITRQ